MCDPVEFSLVVAPWLLFALRVLLARPSQRAVALRGCLCRVEDRDRSRRHHTLLSRGSMDFFSTPSPVEGLVNKATDPGLLAPDWQTVVQITDMLDGLTPEECV